MYVGIDTSKDFFDATGLEEEQVVLQTQYSNKTAGFEQLLISVKTCKMVIIEATGPYYLPLAMFLSRNNIPVSVVNPLIIKRFSQMKMSRAKTDKKDSFLIAQYGQIHKPSLWKAPANSIVKIKQLDTYMEGLAKRRQMALNQLHAFQSSGDVDDQLVKEIKEEVALFDIKISKIEKQIDKLIQKEHKDMATYLRSIPGIGPKSAYLMIIATNGFKDFENYKQVISYFGLAPRIYESGSSVRGSTKICKMGMSKVRKTLYMAARQAIRFNKACKELYDRLRAKGKSHRLALIAAVNKLIKQAFSIVKNKKMYNPEYCAVQ